MDPAKLLAPINDADPSAPGYLPTIGDRLDARHVSWAWYAGGWNDALAGNPDPLFQFHHQPFAYYRNYADGTPGRAAHLKDEADLLTDLARGVLPAVSFVKPLGPNNEHPGYADLLRGQQHVAALVAAIQQSPAWRSTVIVITYDEFGGRWDHVPPPRVDGWGPGTRIPAILVSPFAHRGLVDHTQYETVSILKLIEHRWHLAPLSARDANPAVADLADALDLE
jgi:phospholipase C